MTTITLKVSAELESKLEKAARLQGTDVATFLLESVRERLRPDVLPKAEAQLLQVINTPVATEARAKRDALLAEQAKRTLRDEERFVLADLIDTVELANAARWQALAQLAELRGLSLPEIMRELEIPYP